MKSEVAQAAICMVLLGEPYGAGPNAVDQALSRFLERGTYSVIEGEDGAAILSWNGADFAVMHVDRPIPSETFSLQLNHGTGDQSGARAAAEDHNAHLIVSALTPPQEFGHAIMLAIAVMRVSAMLGDGNDPTGAYWSGSEMLTDWAAFHNNVMGGIEALRRNAQGGNPSEVLPVSFWTSYRLFGSEEGRVGGFTLGLAPFAGYEIHIEPLPWPAGDVAARLLGVLQYHFQAGPVLRDGETLGVSETERFRIRFVESGQAGMTAVLELE